MESCLFRWKQGLVRRPSGARRLNAKLRFVRAVFLHRLIFPQVFQQSLPYLLPEPRGRHHLHIRQERKHLLAQFAVGADGDGHFAGRRIGDNLRGVQRFGHHVREAVGTETQHDALGRHHAVGNGHADDVVKTAVEIGGGVADKRHVLVTERHKAIQRKVGNAAIGGVVTEEKPAGVVLFDVIRVQHISLLPPFIITVGNFQRPVVDGRLDKGGKVFQPPQPVVAVKIDNVLTVDLDAQTELQFRDDLIKPHVGRVAPVAFQHIHRAAQVVEVLNRQLTLEDGERGVGIAVATLLPFERHRLNGRVVTVRAAQDADVVLQLAQADARAAQVHQLGVDLGQEVIDGVFPEAVAEAMVKNPIPQ